MSYHKYKVLGVPSQNGRPRTGAESGHEALLSMYLFGSSAVSAKGCAGKGNFLSIHLSEATSLLAHHPIKTNRLRSFYTSFAVFCRFLMALSIHPFGLKEGSNIDFLSIAPLYRFSLALHPSGLFLLKALFLRALLRPPSASRFEGT